MAELNTFCWNELNARDAVACKKFYTAVFGWTSQDRPFAGTTYTVFKNGDHDVAGMLQMTPEWGDMKPHWMAYIKVENCDASAKKVSENGGKVCVPPTDIPGIGRFAVIEDPNGAYISILQPRQ